MVRHHQFRKSVLIPANSSPKSLTAVRSLGSHGVHTVVASSKLRDTAFASKYCDEVFVVPSPWEDLLAYRDALLKLAARPDVSTITPSLEEDAFLLSKYADEFGDHVARTWPSFEALRTVQDGKRLAEVAKDIGLSVPETMRFEEVDDWSRELIVKPRYAILTSEYEPSLPPTACEGKADPLHPAPGETPSYDGLLADLGGNPPLVQEYVPIASEYSFRALYDNGEAVATSLKRQIRGKTYAGGASVFSELTHDERIEELGRRLLDHLGWHGLATVQFIEDARTGEVTLTEINPRMWESMSLDVRGGVDYPYYLWLLAQGRVDQIETHDREGHAAHLLLGEAKYLLSILQDDYPNAERPAFQTAVREVLSSIYEHPNFYYLVRDDPAPFLRGVVNVLSTGKQRSSERIVELFGDRSMETPSEIERKLQ